MKIFKNRYLDTLAKLILLSAVTHMSVVLLYSTINCNIINLNYFSILDLELFFPNIIHKQISHLASGITVIILFTIIYFFFTKKDKQ